MPPPWIPDSIGDYRRDRPGWIDQPLQNKKHTASQNTVCNQCCAHEDTNSQIFQVYERRTHNNATFESLALTIQERASRHLVQIAVFEIRAAGNRTDLAVQQVAIANQQKGRKSQSARMFN